MVTPQHRGQSAQSAATAENFDTRDKKPPHERKTDEAPARNVAGSTAARDDSATRNEFVRGDANAIGSPDIFLADRHRELPRGSVRITQVKADGADRAYVITEGSKVGYFELSEGMGRAEAEAALRGAYDGTAVVL